MHKQQQIDLDCGEEMDEQLSLKEKINKVYQDLYLGRDTDNLSITTRLTLVEKTTERIVANLNKISWLLLAAVIGIIVDIFKGLIH